MFLVNDEVRKHTWKFCAIPALCVYLFNNRKRVFEYFVTKLSLSFADSNCKFLDRNAELKCKRSKHSVNYVSTRDVVQQLKRRFPISERISVNSS